MNPAPVTEDWTRSRIRRTATLTMIILLLAWSIDYVDRFAIGMALPSIGAEFGLSKTLQGLLVTTFAVVYLACQVPAGFLADRFGSRKPMLVTLVLWSGFTALTGLAGTFGVLLAMRALFGISQGCFPAASFKAVAERTTPDRRATVTGVMLASSGVGPGLAPLIVAPLIAAVGWRHTFLWLALGGVLIGVLLWSLLPKPLPARLNATVGNAPPVSASRREVLRSPQLWKFAVLFCSMNMLAYGLITWVPSYLLEARHVSMAQTGLLSAIPMLVTVVTTILGGWLFDRFFAQRARWFLASITLGTAVLLGLMTAAGTTAEFTVYETLAIGLSGLSTMCIFGLPLRILPPALTGTGMSVLNFGGQVAGASAPLLMGWLADTFSYTAAFGLLIFTTALAAIFAFWVPQRPEQFRLGRAGRQDEGLGQGAAVPAP
ncbi:MFS transporter [Amycolatopsis sp. NPDC059021]|uniref:MFS transporter n=1 Tax=Amycolatopsis sp. NPDC059021 TaxID=3346704 RepID=UPI0036724AAC